jgi:hypothetical protein
MPPPPPSVKDTVRDAKERIDELIDEATSKLERTLRRATAHNPAEARLVGGMWGASSLFLNFLRLGDDSWMSIFGVETPDSRQRMDAAGEWMQGFFRAVGKGTETGNIADWFSTGIVDRADKVFKRELRHDHFGSGIVTGDTLMNAWMVRGPAQSLLTGGLKLSSVVGELAFQRFASGSPYWGTSIDGFGLSLIRSSNGPLGLSWPVVPRLALADSLFELSDPLISDRGLATRGFRPPPGTRQIPEGIPEVWRMRSTQGEGGVWYYDPTNKGNAVRVMPGDPTSPFPNSQSPYVRWQRNGQPLDVNGNVLPTKYSPDAHIPLQDFRFNPDLFK